MAFLLMVFLTLICLLEEFPGPLWGGSPRDTVVLTWAGVLLVGMHAFLLSWTVRRSLVYQGDRDLVLSRYDRWRFYHQIGLFVFFCMALALLGWGKTVQTLWTWDGKPAPGTELLLLSPLLVCQVLSWIFFYDADRTAYRVTHRPLDADPFASSWLETPHTSSPTFGGRWTYVAFQMRQRLALVFIPVLMLMVYKDAERLLQQTVPIGQTWFNLLGFLSLMGVFLGLPIIIRLVLGLRPLPDGPLRDRLMAAMHRLGFRCSNILLWNTRSGMANAMVVGLVPWLRYVVFTDRLLAEFSEDEVEAVFGHEVGHIRHQHMGFYLIFLTLSMTALGLLSEHYLLPVLASAGDALAHAAPEIVPADFGQWFTPRGPLAPFPVVLVLLGYIFMVFGYVSRNCERQADIFGCRAVSCHDTHCVIHDETTRLVSRGAGLCPTGIATFIRALEKVACVNGISRDQPGFLQSWQHCSIARRVAFLKQMVADPQLEPRFQRRLRIFKVVLMLALGGAVTWLLLLHGF